MTTTATTDAHRAIGYGHGDVVHLALRTPDVDATRFCYAKALGWTYLPYGRVDGSVPSIGFRPGAPQMTGDFAVTDLAENLATLRAAGGQAGEIERRPWGTVTQCLDDQDTPIRLHELPRGSRSNPRAANPQQAGDPFYLTRESSTPPGPAPSTAPSWAGRSARGGSPMDGRSRAPPR